MNNPKLQVEHVSITDLQIPDYYTRNATPKIYQDLQRSIEQHGQVKPIIINGHRHRKNIILDGVTTYEVLKKLNYKTIPVIALDISSAEQEKQLSFRLNAIAGEWNYEKLSSLETSFLCGVGFSADDLLKVQAFLHTEDDITTQKDKETAIVTPATEHGSLWQLGRHRLLCGDSRKIEDVERLVGEQKVSMHIHDFPYNINLSYDKGVGGKQSYGGRLDDNLSDREYREFIAQVLSNAKKISQPDSHFFSWCDQRYVGLFQEIYQELAITYKRTVLWVKNADNPTDQVAFHKSYEPVIYGVTGKPHLAKVKDAGEILNRDIPNGNRRIDEIYDHFDIWLARKLDPQSYQHPTQKPPSLYEKPIRRCTKVGDAVLDLFGGSGVTLSACEQLGRRAFICEIEPAFCDVIKQRYQDLTGDTPLEL
jgi:DNA modification methylase